MRKRCRSIRQLALSARAAIEDETLSAATLEALNGGRSAAHVFGTPFFGRDRGLTGAPVVVKIAPRAQGIPEKANYDEFVQGLLPAPSGPICSGSVGRGHTRVCAIRSSVSPTETGQYAHALSATGRGLPSWKLVLRQDLRSAAQDLVQPGSVSRRKRYRTALPRPVFHGRRSMAATEATLGPAPRATSKPARRTAGT